MTDFSMFRSGVSGPDKDPLFGISTNFPKLIEVELDKLRPNPDQPRRHFDEESLQELAASIAEKGLLQPITIKDAHDGTYLLVAGERRYRAHQLLERRTIPAILTEGNPDELALIENLQREDLRPLEEAEALARLMERYNYGQEQVAQIVGKARPTITSLLRLNSLPEVIKAESSTANVPKSVLMEIARVENEADQLSLWEQAKTGRMTVRTARQKKETGEVAPVVTPAIKMLSSGRSFVRKLKRLPPDHLSANRDHYFELLKLKAEIDSVLQSIGMLPEETAMD